MALVFHLLDIQSRDQTVIDEGQKVIYEPPPTEDLENSDEEFQTRRRGAGRGPGGRGGGSRGGRREFVIHLFGKTADGRAVRVDAVGFRPTFYIALPDAASNADSIDRVQQYMRERGIAIDECTFQCVMRESFFGFSARTKRAFLEITFASLGKWREARALFLNDKMMPAVSRALGGQFGHHAPEVFEANIDPMLRFLHCQNVQPCGWVQIADGLEAADDDDDGVSLSCEYDLIEPCTAPPRASAQFIIASWDIECYSATGEFPIAKKDGAWKNLYKALEKVVGKPVEMREAVERLIGAGVFSVQKGAAAAASLERALASIGAMEGGVEEVVNSVRKWLEPHGDPVIQIGVVLTTDCKQFDRHLFVWPACDKWDGATVHCFANERTMIAGFFKWLAEINPDILLGYNVFGFDEKYLWERGQELGCLGDGTPVHRLNRLFGAGGGAVKLEEKFLSSSAMGDNYLFMWSTQGRLQIDLYHYVRRNVVLPSYKLDEVTKNFMSGKLKGVTAESAGGGNNYNLVLNAAGAVKDVRVGRAICLLDGTGESLTEKMVVESVDVGTGKIVVKYCGDAETLAEITGGDAQKWVVVKDDVSPQDIFRLHRGSSADRAVIGRYCLQDCDLVLELYKKLEVFNNAMSMANVCTVPINYIFVRGQGIKAESLIFKACRQRDILIPVLPAPRQPGDSGGGGGGVGGQEDSYEGAIVLDPEPGFYCKSPIGVADFASLYPSTIESENISHDSLVWVKDYDYSGRLICVQFGSDRWNGLTEGYGYTDIEFDIWRPDPADKRKHPEKIRSGRRVCRYAQPLDGTKSTLPEIIRSLLAARKAKRKEAERETDPERKALLDAEQLAYKLTGNSLYGQLGSGTFKIRLQHLAASVTGYGRKQIMAAKAIIERFYGDSGRVHIVGAGSGVRCSAKCTAKVVYGDSVTGDTPLPLKISDKILFKRIDELSCIIGLKWINWHNDKELCNLYDYNICVWTERGFTRIKNIIRHRLHPSKKLFRINTHTGVVDVTEDHSLVLANGEEISPKDVDIGTELLHNNDLNAEIAEDVSCTISEDEAFVMGLFVADGSSDIYKCPSGIKASWAINKADTELLKKAQQKCPFPTKILDTLEISGVYKLVPDGNIVEPSIKYRTLFYNEHREKRIPQEIINAPLKIVGAFWDGFYAGDGDKDKNGYIRFDQKGKEIGAGLTLLARRLGYSVSINERQSKENTFRYTMSYNQRKNPIAIKKIRELLHSGSGDIYVYDLETENHHFGVGPGALIVHNTDSLFVEFNPVSAETGAPLEGREARQAVIDLTAAAGKMVTKVLKPPHDFEFDKIFDPMLMFSKKRYAGLMYEENADDFVYKYMGIALKRRDNAPIVKTIFGAAMKKLLLERDVAGATELVKTMTADLVAGKVSIGQLTITKSLRGEYADPSRIAHKALADRIAARDPGNAPASGDRIGFVYVKPEVGQMEAKLQGDRIETPAFVKANGLMPDYRFYIEHQLKNPISQMFGIVLEQMPGFSVDYMTACPVDKEKTIGWRENVAAELLFGGALGACSADDKTKFFTKYFGGAKKIVGTDAPVQKTSSKKPIVIATQQSQISNYILDSFLIDNMNKEQKAAANIAKTTVRKRRPTVKKS